MRTDPQKRRGWLLVAGWLVLLLVLYLVSLGPAAYLFGKGIISRDLYLSIYAPAYSFPPLAELLVRYADWWASLAK